MVGQVLNSLHYRSGILTFIPARSHRPLASAAETCACLLPASNAEYKAELKKPIGTRLVHQCNIIYWYPALKLESAY